MGEIKGVEDLQCAALQTVGLAIENLSDLSEYYSMKSKAATGWYTLVPRLSTMRVFIPQRLNQVDSMRPAGPAPTMRTSTWSSLAGAVTDMIYREGMIRNKSIFSMYMSLHLI
jgi:hypothetical protein